MRCLAAARAGLEISAAEAIHGYDVWLRLMCCAAALGAQTAMRHAANSRPSRPWRCGAVTVPSSTICAAGSRACGGARRGPARSKSAVLLAAEAGLPWLESLARLAMSQLLGDVGDRQGAEAQVRAADDLSQRLGSPLLRLATLFTRAGAASAFDDEAAVVEPLQAALALARELGVHHVAGLPPAMLATLCATALRHGIAVDHTRMLIGAGRLAPPPAALRLRRWPWAFEVMTLGGFSLRRGSEPVEFSAKGPGRPVELLKVLISLGGQSVRADQLADALWPHVDADYAHKSFTATLHRLRRIFGADDTLHLRDGRLSLNATMFWLDTWAIDHLLVELEALLRDADAHALDHALPPWSTKRWRCTRAPTCPTRPSNRPISPGASNCARACCAR